MTTITRAAIAEYIYSEVGLSRIESAHLLESVLELIKRRLEQGESVKLSGFGTFSIRKKSGRIGRNPKTGVEKLILPRTVLLFRPSQTLKFDVNANLPETVAAEGGD